MKVNFDEKKPSRGYLIVINNPTAEDEAALRGDDHEYCVYQIEKGEEEGTEHIQGFVYYKSARKFGPLKKKYPRAHIEPMKCMAALMKYSQKCETRVRGPYEFGTKPEQGRRNDLEAAAQRILDGETVADLLKSDPVLVVRNFRGLQFAENNVKKHRTTKPYVEWIFGKSGAGKTKRVHDKHGADNIYIKDGTQWWDGYNNEDAILIDDFNGKWEFRNLLQALDWYKFQGQNKGGYLKINSPFIYITCEFPPEEMFAVMEGQCDSENRLMQVLGRIDKIVEMKSNPNGPSRKMPVREVVQWTPEGDHAGSQ